MYELIFLMKQIFNRGKRLKDIGTASLHIEWPKMTKEKKNLLYLMNINSTDLKQIECSPTEEINPNNMVSKKSSFIGNELPG